MCELPPTRRDGKAWMPSSKSVTHRAGHGSDRSAASAAGRASRFWTPGVAGAGDLDDLAGRRISAAAARDSSMDPNGSAVPCVNTVGTLMSRRCSGACLPRRKTLSCSTILRRLAGLRVMEAFVVLTPTPG